MGGNLHHLDAKELEEWTKVLKKELGSMPRGSLTQKMDRGRTYFAIHWYEDGLRFRQGITKDEDKVALYARKAFLVLLIKRLEKKIALLGKQSPMFFQDDWQFCIEKLASRFPQVEREVFLTGKPSSNISQSTNPLHPESNIHTTQSGIKVKSRSELAIANMLTQCGIPFRYEEAYTVGETIFFPDFTIIRPRDHKVFYWEHFGIAHLPADLTRMDSKLKNDRANGIVPWDNLILTYDTQDGSLNIKHIRAVINGWLL